MRKVRRVGAGEIESLFKRLGLPVTDLLRSHPGIVLTGGAVRDLVLGRTTKDVDFTVERGDPIRAGRRFADMTGGNLVVLGQEKLVRVQTSGVTVDFTPLRAGSLESDLRRRDFTVNAMGIRLPAGGEAVIVDPLKGIEDLKKGVLRTCGPRVFKEDPVRLWRAIRLPLELGLKPNPETRREMTAATSKIRAFPAERLRDEIFKLLDGPLAAKGLEMALKCGLLTATFPETKGMTKIRLGGGRSIRVFDHTLEAMACLDRLLSAAKTGFGPDRAEVNAHIAQEPVPGRSRMALLKLALLFHDIAKPETASVAKGGRVHFFEHERLGAEKAGRIMRSRLRCAEVEVAIVRRIIVNHLRIGYLSGSRQVSDRAIFRFLRDAGSELYEIILHGKADLAATHYFGSVSRPKQERIVGRILEFRRRAAKRRGERRILNGNDIMKALKVKEGPLVGELLRHVEEEVALGRVKTREEALKCAAKALDRPRKKMLH